VPELTLRASQAAVADARKTRLILIEFTLRTDFSRAETQIFNKSPVLQRFSTSS